MQSHYILYICCYLVLGTLTNSYSNNIKPLSTSFNKEDKCSYWNWKDVFRSKIYYRQKSILSRLGNRKFIFKILLIFIIFFAVWLMIALLSFNPFDPSWSQTAWNESISNMGGISGAWVADILFFIFGIIAYAIPIIIISGCWIVWYYWQSNNYIDYFAISLHLIGALILILASCGLAEINADDIWYFTSGGVFGSLLSTTLQRLLYSSTCNIVLLCIWVTGLTLFTSCSWISITEKIGGIIFNIFDILTFSYFNLRK